MEELGYVVVSSKDVVTGRRQSELWFSNLVTVDGVERKSRGCG